MTSALRAIIFFEKPFNMANFLIDSEANKVTNMDIPIEIKRITIDELMIMEPILFNNKCLFPFYAYYSFY